MTEPLPPDSDAADPAAAPRPSRPKSKFQQCHKHGRVYDASQADGCTQCIAEGTTADAPEPGDAPIPADKRGLPQWVVLVTLLVVLAIIVLPKLLGGGGGAAVAGDQAPTARPAQRGAGGDDDISRGRPRSRRFDPATYEAPIRALEIALYGATEADAYAAAGRADGAARLLMAQVLARNTGSVVAQDFMRALEATVTRLDPGGQGGYVLPDFTGARGNWERIRTEYFQDAEWFHTPLPIEEVGVGAGGAAAAAREESPAAIQVSAFASDIERIITTYRSTLLGFPDPGEATGAPGEEAQRARDYQTFVDRWNDELDAARRMGPRSWRTSEESYARLSAATRELERALGSLRGAAPQGRTTLRTQRAAALRSAETAIQNARRALAVQPSR